MNVADILLILAIIFAVLDIALWNARTGYQRYILTPAAVILVCISLLIA